AVENKFGKGKTLLIGSYPGAGYFLHHSDGTREFFAGLLKWGNVTQGVHSSDPEVKVRLHEGAGGKYLWVLNPTRSSREVTISLGQVTKKLRVGKDIWTGNQPTFDGNVIKVSVGDRDSAIIPLQ